MLWPGKSVPRRLKPGYPLWGKPLAAMISIRELEYVEHYGTASPHPRGALSLVGAWKDISEEELDKAISDIYEAREKDTGRTVKLEV
jgi:hypothetical protein